MANGAYLIVEHTEAMHVIDVNSGGRAYALTAKGNQDNNALQVNLDAATAGSGSCACAIWAASSWSTSIDLHNPNNRKALYEVAHRR